MGQDLRVVILRRALTGVEVLNQKNEGEEVGWPQGAGTGAAETTGSCQHVPGPAGSGADRQV